MNGARGHLLGPLAALLVVAAFLAIGCEDACVPAEPDAGPGPADAGPTGFGDPLSMPLEPTLTTGNFTPARDCGDCHLEHYDEWRTSMHSYAMVDPVFRRLVAVRQQDFQGKQDKFCVQCHSAIATRGGEIVENFRFEELSEIALDGVTCEACHKVSEVARPYNSGHVIDEYGPMRGPIPDPEDNDFHASAHSPLHEESLFCAGCHDVREVNGLPLERPYAEWLASPGYDSQTCQSCHMPTYVGRATPDSPERELHRHFFLGVDVPLLEGYLEPESLEAHKARVTELLQDSGTVRLTVSETTVRGGQLDVFVSVKNNITAHNLPTGSTFMRQLWVELLVTDASGEVVYESGTLDDNGDLKDHFSTLLPYADLDLIHFGSRLLDERGNPVIYSWRATEHTSTALEPLYERTFTRFVPVPTDAAGPLTVRARLRFRSHAPFLLRELDLEPLVERLEIVDVSATERSVELLGP